VIEQAMAREREREREGEKGRESLMPYII